MMNDKNTKRLVLNSLIALLDGKDVVIVAATNDLARHIACSVMIEAAHFSIRCSISNDEEHSDTPLIRFRGHSDTPRFYEPSGYARDLDEFFDAEDLPEIRVRRRQDAERRIRSAMTVVFDHSAKYERGGVRENSVRTVIA